MNPVENPILQAKHLNLYYGEKQALKDINIDIPHNEITALIGPSGCGKSTFLRTLNRMNDLIEGVKIEGEIFFEGKDAYRAYDVAQLRKRVGMVFQKPNPFPMSIYDNMPAHARHQKARGAGRNRGEKPKGRGPVGRGARQAENQRHGPFRWPAAKAVHRPSAGGGAGGAADG